MGLRVGNFAIAEDYTETVFSFSLAFVKMSRSIIQFSALFVFITIIAAEPNCTGIESKYLKDCTTLHRRWYELKDEVYKENCKELRPVDNEYNSCMQRVNKEATDRLYAELPEDAANSIIYPYSGLRAKATLVNGNIVKMEFPEESSWLSRIFG